MITAKILKKFDLFASLSNNERTRLAVKAGDIRLRAGAWLAREGELLAFFVVLSGCIEVKKEIGGLEHHVAEIKAGDFFGEVNALFGIPAVSGLRAKSNCRVAAFDQSQLQELLQSSTPCGELIRRAMRSRLEDGPRHAMDLPSARVRIVGSRTTPALSHILTFLKSNRIAYEWKECGHAEGEATLFIDGMKVGLPVSARDIADTLGLSIAPSRSEYDVLIVGGGPAGLAAAVYGASEGLRVLLVEEKAMGGQAGTSTRIENYLGFPSGIAGEDLAGRAVRQAQRFGAELILTRRVLHLEKTAACMYRVFLDGDESVLTRTVILAMGVRWRVLDAEGISGLLDHGVSYGVAGIEPANLSGKRVFLVGGGNSAGQAAVALAKYATSVTLLVRGTSLDGSMSQYLIEQLRQQSNIHVETETTIFSATGKGHLHTLRTIRDGVVSTPRRADALYILIGADASTGWLPSAVQRDEQGFIRTGRDVVVPKRCPASRIPLLLETSMPGVFCAGDVRSDSVKRVSSAVGEGSMAIAVVHEFLAQQYKSTPSSSLMATPAGGQSFLS